MRVIAAVLYEMHERDWMPFGMCEVGDPRDTRFIRKPTPAEDDEWGALCAQCPVFSECLRWADREDVAGVYVAGEWRG